MFEYRFDRAEISDSRYQDGFLRAKVRLTKPGVFPYLMADGTVRKEAKPPEEIYSESFLKSLDGIVVTDGHPYEMGGLVNSENYKTLVKGVIMNPRIEDGFVVADEILFDKELIESVKSGVKAEVSLGLKSNTILEAGVLDGVRYDSKQTDLIGNHVAHVVKGRIGPEARTILDGIQYATLKGENQMPDPVQTPTEEPSWVKKILEGFDKLFTLFGSKTEPVTDAKPEPAKTNTEPKEDVGALKKQISDLQTVINSMSQNLGLKMDEAVQRESLVDAVKAVLPDANLKGLSNLQIKKTLISNQFPELKLDSDDLVDVYYNASLELAKAKAKVNPGKTETVVNDALETATIAELRKKRLNLYVEGK